MVERYVDGDILLPGFLSFKKGEAPFVPANDLVNNALDLFFDGMAQLTL